MAKFEDAKAAAEGVDMASDAMYVEKRAVGRWA